MSGHVMSGFHFLVDVGDHGAVLTCQKEVLAVKRLLLRGRKPDDTCMRSPKPGHSKQPLEDTVIVKTP